MATNRIVTAPTIMGKSTGSNESEPENQNFLCMHLLGTTELEDAKRELLGVSDGAGDLQIRNRYFAAQVQLKSLAASNDDECSALLRSCPAVLVALSEETDVTDAKRWWDAWEKTVNENAVRLFVVPFQMSSERLLQEVRTWGVEHRIEVVSPEICAEDETSVNDRIRNALDCAKWGHHQQDTNQSDIPAPSHEVHRKLADGNALRRGLNEDDKLNILSQLLDEDESE